MDRLGKGSYNDDNYADAKRVVLKQVRDFVLKWQLDYFMGDALIEDSPSSHTLTGAEQLLLRTAIHPETVKELGSLKGIHA